MKPIKVETNAKIIALAVILLLSALYLFPMTEETISFPVKGFHYPVFNNIYSLATWNQIVTEIDLASATGAKTCFLDISHSLWTANGVNPEGETFQNLVLKTVNLLRQKGLFMVVYPTTKSTVWDNDDIWALINSTVLQDEWISIYSDILIDTKADAICLMDEPPGGVDAYGPINVPQTQLWQQYKNFCIRMVNAYRAIKPNIPILAMSAPSWDMSYIAADPLPFDNIIYQFNVFMTDGFPEVIDLWNTGQTESAKALWRKVVLQTGRIAETGRRGNAVQACIDKGLKIQCGAFGSTFFPFIPEWMEYHIQLMNELNAGFVIYCVKTNPRTADKYGILNEDGTSLNEIGQLWNEYV